MWNKTCGSLRSTCPPSNYSCLREQGGSEGPGQHSTSVVINQKSQWKALSVCHVIIHSVKRLLCLQAWFWIWPMPSGILPHTSWDLFRNYMGQRQLPINGSDGAMLITLKGMLCFKKSFPVSMPMLPVNLRYILSFSSDVVNPTYHFPLLCPQSFRSKGKLTTVLSLYFCSDFLHIH